MKRKITSATTSVEGPRETEIAYDATEMMDNTNIVTSRVIDQATSTSVEVTKSQRAVKDLEEYLSSAEIKMPPKIQDQPFALTSLSAKDALRAHQLLWDQHVERIRQERASEIASQQVTIIAPNNKSITMKYWSKLYHPTERKPTTQPMPLYIGLHGGGGCPPTVNDQQWRNHKIIYDRTYQALATNTKTSLLYIAPRAPTNNWKLWHEPHMDVLLDRLIETMVATQNVDSNRIYLSGYSAGGDGVYKLAPRMVDRWAAVSMMAGHPNGVSLRGLYNLPFSLHVGGKDSVYNRNGVAREYKAALEKWQQEEQKNGFRDVWAKVYEDKGHWLGGQDAEAMEWMAKYSRNPSPRVLNWDKGSARHKRFYWIHRSSKNACGEIRIILDGQKVIIDLTKCPDPGHVGNLTLRFNDAMIDMEKPIEIYQRRKDEKEYLLVNVQLKRNIKTICETLAERGDPNAVYCGQVKVDLKEAADNGKKTKALLRGG